MNPSLMWHSEIFRAYLFILAGLLAVVGALLGLLTWGFKKHLDSIWLTYRSWVVMIFIGMGAVLLGQTPTIILLVLLAVFGFKEFARATGLYEDWWMTGAAYLAIIALGVAAGVPAAGGTSSAQWNRFLSIPMFATAAFLVIPIIRNRTQSQLQAMALTLFGFTCIGWMFLHLLFLARQRETLGHLLFLVTAVELSDVAAFTCGKIFGASGRHLLRGKISPGKTWEGALGGLAVAMALPWMMRFSFPLFGPPQLILTGLIVGVGGQLGDLAVSVIKRDLGQKDMGTAIPGHGGILDRIDSLSFAAPLFVHMVNGFYHYW
jgi:phosphatidate cytidylyltransferase